ELQNEMIADANAWTVNVTGGHGEELLQRKTSVGDLLAVELALFLSELGAGPTRRYLVARSGPSTVGYGGLMVSVGEGHITTLAVDPAWQRRSVGTRLLHALATHAVDEGCTGLTLEVRMGNLGAQALYRRFGFVPAGVRRNYYAETKEDALIMWAHEVDTPAYAERLAAIAERLSVPAPGGAP
ncbi:MAG: ribosomal protein S18-alanine N-acetyltransferase, partial [Actinobacteria bacterium]|nr:ribosomal protein S18-alanine N-acetyltransferase [Actinomycetota bacterium]